MNRKHILLIDDELALLKLYHKLLTDRGHVVDQATSVEEAHRLIAQNRYDICLCDMTLGLHSGTELLRYSPALRDQGTVFAVMSGKERYAELCASIGVPFFLKPLATNDLLSLVETTEVVVQSRVSR